MKKHVLSLAWMGILGLAFCGCASKQVSLVEKNLVTIEKHGSEKVRIMSTDVYQQDGQVWAYGVLEQQSAGTGVVKTHVDIRVVAADGSVSYETISDDVYVPGHRIGKGIHWKRFKSPLGDQLADGSQITMTVCSGSHTTQM